MRPDQSVPRKRWLRDLTPAVCVLAAIAAHASVYGGQVTANGLPVPGATVIATQGARQLSTTTDAQGVYVFADLPDGAWTLRVEMSLFAPLEQTVTVTPNTPGIRWELKMLPLEQLLAQAQVVHPGLQSAPAVVPAPAAAGPVKPSQTAEAPKPPPPDEAAQANDGFLVNGSVNNAATSPFSLLQGFGNTRSTRSLYTGALGVFAGDSALDARPYSLTGLDTPKPAYNRLTLVASVEGPLNIPHLLRHGPNTSLNYQWTRNSLAAAESGLVPTAAQRAGMLPSGGAAPAVSPQAQALLALYPLPNLPETANYNYQVPVVNSTHIDALQLHMNDGFHQGRDQVFGSFASERTRTSDTNLFGFVDRTATLGLNANVNWERRLPRSFFLTTTFRFSRLRTNLTPFFASRTNVSGAAGITGNDQDPLYWGPPTLVFSSGIATVTDGQSAFDRNRTDAVGSSLTWYRGRHNLRAGGEFRREEYNILAQQNPRGTFTFTGTATGTTDFSNFLAGLPDTSTLAFGNADKYLRQTAWSVYANDDWRFRPELTLNLGLRWEYESPASELKQRLVNLDVADGFAAVAPVLAGSPTGALTGEHYGTSLLQPDRSLVEPRFGLSWRPLAGSSLLVRAGYGVYADTSVYEGTALRMAQQAPFSKSLSVENSPACPLTLVSGFNPCGTTTADLFGVDPHFRVGYAQTWQLAVQRDLPGALQVTATYLGVKGTRGVQEFLPNTNPLGAADPCPQCPVGFLYRTSNGNSTREAGSLQLRRRLRSGFTATLLYTYSKSIDNDAVLGGQGPVAPGATTLSLTTPNTSVAQDWRNLRAERSLSSFDQRHLLNASLQYTSGMGLGGGTLLGGWRGRAFKEWTVSSQIAAGSGLPENPLYYAPVSGTGFNGILRPDRTAAPLGRASAPGEAFAGRHFLNAAAFAAPQSGQWGNAGRNSVPGPGQFTLNAALARTFRVDKRFNLDIRADATNLLNHAVFTAYNTTLNPATGVITDPALASPLFGLPLAANPMRSVQLTGRLRF